MTEVKFLEDDVEHTFAQQSFQPKGAPMVELVTTGVSTLVFINGQRINKVLKVNTEQPRGEVSPQVTLTIWADELKVRKVDHEEFKRLAAKTPESQWAGNIQRLQPQPGDVLVVSVDAYLSQENADSIKEQMARIFGGTKVAVLGRGMKLGCVAACP